MSISLTEDCFERLTFLPSLELKKRQLKPGAIPAIFHRQQSIKDQQKLSISRKRPCTEKNEDDIGTSVMEKTRGKFYKKDYKYKYNNNNNNIYIYMSRYGETLK